MKVAYIFILALVFVQCGDPVQDDSKAEPAKEGKPSSVKSDDKVEDSDKVVAHKFVSTEMGVQEYLEMRQNDNGDKEWYYSSEKNLKEVKMGVTSKNGANAIYFLSKPQDLYFLDLETCGFTLTDSKNEEQWYRQTEPKCGI